MSNPSPYDAGLGPLKKPDDIDKGIKQLTDGGHVWRDVPDAAEWVREQRGGKAVNSYRLKLANVRSKLGNVTAERDRLKMELHEAEIIIHDLIASGGGVSYVRNRGEAWLEKRKAVAR